MLNDYDGVAAIAQAGITAIAALARENAKPVWVHPKYTALCRRHPALDKFPAEVLPCSLRLTPESVAAGRRRIGVDTNLHPLAL